MAVVEHFSRFCCFLFSSPCFHRGSGYVQKLWTIFSFTVACSRRELRPKSCVCLLKTVDPKTVRKVKKKDALGCPRKLVKG